MAAATAATAASGPAAAAAASSLRSARKLLERLERQSAPLSVPLPRTVAERLERQAGYDDTKQEVTRWQPIVKVGGGEGEGGGRGGRVFGLTEGSGRQCEGQGEQLLVNNILGLDLH